METTAKSIWTIDPTHSEISFKVKHLMISTVTGSFEEFEGKAETASDDFNDAKFSFTAKIKSVNTKNKDRDQHLQGEDFFDADKFPTMSFESVSYDGETLVGNLTMKGVTKEVSLDVTLNGIAVDPYGQTKAGFEATGVISRKDFGLTWSAVTEAGSVMVGDKVSLIFDVQMIKN